MAGSFSQTSMIASETSPVSKAFSSAPVSIISPREVLMITGFRFSDWKRRRRRDGRSCICLPYIKVREK